MRTENLKDRKYIDEKNLLTIEINYLLLLKFITDEYCNSN